jgi:hypothetical protein
MHRKYAKDGLVAISVSLDDPTDSADARHTRTQALAFLKKQGAAFTNLLLDEEPALFETKLKIDGPPCVYIFNRANRFVVKRDGVGDKGRIDYEDFEKTIVQLLAEKK